MSKLLNPLVKKMLASAIRHGLTLLGGVLMSKGMAEQSDVDAIVGVSAVLAGVAWAGIEKYWTQKTLGAALQLPAGATKADAAVAASSPMAPPASLAEDATVRPTALPILPVKHESFVHKLAFWKH